MEWFYVSNGETVGPVDQLTLKELIRTGAVDMATLVWRADLDDWKPLGEFSDQLGLSAAPLPDLTPASYSPPETNDLEVCAHSGRTLPRSEMLQFGDKWIAPDCKDDFLQTMMEGEELTNVFSEDNRETTLGLWLIMKQSLEIFRKNLPAILICQSIIWIPASLFDSYLVYEIIPEADFGQSLRISNFIDLIVGTIAAAATYGIVSRAWDGEKIGVGEAMGIGFSNYLRFLGTSFLRNLATGIALILLVVPALIVMVRWVVALPAALDAERGGTDAMRESWALTQGHYWKIVGIQLSALCLVGVACLPLVAPLIFFYEFFEMWWADGIFSWLMQLVFSFMFVETFVLYRHLQDN